MKTIKYLAALLCSALVMGACTDTDGLSDQNAGKEKPVVSIEPKVATDFSLEFVLTVGDDASQVAYAVMTGHENQVPTPISILANEVSGAQAGETFMVGESQNVEGTVPMKVALDCSEFSAPSDKYQVFAVAITSEGLVGEVASLDVTMNDKTAPEISGANVNVNTLEIAWTENVVLGTGKAYVTIIAWGVGQYYMKNAEIPAENLSVAGNVLTIVCPEAGDGAGYIVSLDKGVVKDLAGNLSPEIESGLTEEGYAGLGWDTPNSEIPITASSFQTPAEDTNWAAEDANIVFTLPTQMMENTQVKNPISVVYNEAEGVSTLYAEWVLGDDFQTVTVYLPKMPTGEFDVTVKAGAFYDVWGNLSSAFEPTTLRYSNYLVSIKPGYYAVDYNWDEDSGVQSSQFLALFEMVDNNTVLMSADWFELTGGQSLALPTQLVGTVDYAKMTVTFDGTWLYKGSVYPYAAYGMKFYNYDAEGTIGLVFFGSGNTGAEPIVVKFDADGYFTETTSFEYGIYDLVNGSYLGAYSYCVDGSALTFLQSAASAPQMTSNAKAPAVSLKSEFKGGFTK